MRLKELALAMTLAAGVLTACSSAKTYTLSFYQEHGNHADDYTVTVGKTTLDEIKTFANGLKDYTKAGYDRTWDWDNYHFETQETDWTIDALYSLHHYKISFQYNGKEIATSSYTTKDSTYKVPDMKPVEPGYKYVFPTVQVKGKTEDIVIPMTLEKLTYTLKFYLDDEDPAPKSLTYSVNAPTIVAPDGVEGYDCVWKTKDGQIKFDAGEEVNMTTKYGEAKFGNYDLYLNKTPKKYTYTLNVNGGSMMGETSKQITFGDPCDLPVPTFKNDAKFLGWADSVTGKLMVNGQPYSVASDATLYARYGADFETDASMALVDKGSRNCIESKELDSETKTRGNKSLKIISQGSETFSCGFDADLITAAFNDPSVVAINFDAKGSVPCTKLSVQNNTTSAYEYKNLGDGGKLPGYGLQTEWKTFSLTRADYEAAENKTSIFWTVGNQLPIGSTVWFDNIQPVSTELTPWGFENSRLVEYNPEPGTWYNKALSYRNMLCQEIFTYVPTVAADSKFRFDYDIKSEGNRSVTAHKYKDKNVNVSILNCGDVDYVTFDVYVTTALNPKVTILCADKTPLDENTLQANTWTTYTVTREHMLYTASANLYIFLWLTGSPDYDIYFDNIRVTTK